MTDTLKKIKELREITGAGFLDCKKALEENNDNIDQSIDFLRKKGLAKASKKSSREAKEGAVGIYMNDNQAVLLEINSETDFAAKNNLFLDFMDKIGKYILENESSKNLNLEEFLEKKFEEKSISDHFNEIIAKIGENIVLKKIIVMKNEQETKFYSYIHNNYRPNIGKICVILKAQVKEESEQTTQLGKNLCMHIAASKPLALDSDQLDPNLVEKEKEIQMATIKASGKPNNILDKILEGKMRKFYSEVTLLNQSYIMDPDKNIRKILDEFSKENTFDIKEFSIFVLGS